MSTLNNIDSETIMTICVLILSLVSIFISVRALKIQRTHNEKSVKPIAELTADDYENEIAIELFNVGVGPLIIKEIKVENVDGKTHTNIMDFIDIEVPKGLFWTNFVMQTSNRVVAIGSKVCLLSINFDEAKSLDKDTRKLVNKFQSELRKLLGDLTVTVKYTGIYENMNFEYVRKLDWYKRHNQ